MQLTNYYWYFKSAIPHRICDDIVRYGKSIQDQMAVTGGLGNKKLNKNQVKDLKKKRDSNIVWMSDRWIYKEIQPYVHQANQNAGWNFQWDFSESCQFTKYEKSQFYDWHCDGWDKPYNQPNTMPIIKLTFFIFSKLTRLRKIPLKVPSSVLICLMNIGLNFFIYPSIICLLYTSDAADE